MRVARPTNRLRELSRMYAEGLGFEVLGEFVNHRGFDGVILGHPSATYHLEFTAQRDHVAALAPDADHLLVFYIPDQSDWDDACARMTAAGFQPVPSWNPYWDENGRTFEDIDGYRVVLQNGSWDL